MPGEAHARALYGGPGTQSLYAFADHWSSMSGQLRELSATVSSAAHAIDDGWEDGTQQAGANTRNHAQWVSDMADHANAMARQRDSVFEQAALDDLERLFAHLAASSTPDANGVSRRSLDIAGNGRFVRNVVERSEEEREFRLDHLDSAGAHVFTDEELMTITAVDVRNSVEPLLRGLGLELPR